MCINFYITNVCTYSDYIRFILYKYKHMNASTNWMSLIDYKFSTPKHHINNNVKVSKPVQEESGLLKALPTNPMKISFSFHGKNWDWKFFKRECLDLGEMK